MNIYIPIADVTLTDGQTYDGQLPVWATRPLMVKVTTETNKPVNIDVKNDGSSVKTVTLPYQQNGMDVDLSFAAPLLKRADRNVSEGTPQFIQQALVFWTSSSQSPIIIPVFHCDLTYWDTLGADAALPQPPKPRIPGQTLDIFFPYVIHPSDAFYLEVEPVAGTPGNVIFPATYVLGNTIDISYIKKLTIKNVWGNGLDQVINYEDRLMSDAVYDTGLQCALRARWNMRNGQWFWAAFKDYFWSNKFTLIRGRGGVTEQAEITINLEYGEEYYNVYQELLVSSNVVFELNIPGINQYQSKRFRVEVSGDTGARWSNSTKTYRQQVRFKTTELQDNYMFPLAPDQPPTPEIVFSARYNPLTFAPSYSAGGWTSVYSNAAYYVESEPSWLAVTNGTTLLTPDMFEQGSALATPGLTWGQAKTSTPNSIRTKRAFTGLNAEIYSLISGVPGYKLIYVYFGADGKIVTNSPLLSINGRVNTGAYQQVAILISKTDGTAITPADIATLNAYWGKRYHRFPAGDTLLYGMIASNTGEPRTGNIVLKSFVGSTTYNIAVKQAGTTGNISTSPSTLNVDYLTPPVTVNVTSFGAWAISQKDSWITPSVTTGANGTTTVTLTIGDNLPAGASARTGAIKFRNDLTGKIATVTVNQGGAPASIKILPIRISGPKAGGNRIVTAAVTSENDWTMGSAPSWVSIMPTSGGPGQTAIAVKFDTPNNTGAARTGQLRLEDTTTHEIAICLITQEG